MASFGNKNIKTSQSKKILSKCTLKKWSQKYLEKSYHTFFVLLAGKCDIYPPAIWVFFSYRKQIAIVFSWHWCLSKGWKPMNTESTKNGLNGFPSGFSGPSCFFFFQRLDSSFVIPNRRYLSTKHNWCEKGKQEAFKHQK